jgi:hypothetical protein
MDQAELIDAVVGAWRDDARMRALFLSGSFGRGSADRFSDVDFLAVIAPDDQEAVAADWRARLEAIAPIVYWNRLPFAFVLNAITRDWLRCDLEVAAPGRIGTRAQDRLKPLLDRDGIYASRPKTIPDPGPTADKVLGLVLEFLRVLGLSAVVLGREEYEVGATGAGLLRGLLTQLLIAETGQTDTGGVLHLSRVLDGERMAALAALPVAGPSRDSVLEANRATARMFLPRARVLLTRLGGAWPEAFEAATRRALTRALPEHSADW